MNLATNTLADAIKTRLENAKLVDSVTLWKDDDIASAAQEMRGKSQSNIFIFPSSIDVENTLESACYIKSTIKRNYTICVSAVDPKRRKNGSTQLNETLDAVAKILHTWIVDADSICLVERASQLSLDQADNPGRHSWLLEISIQPTKKY